MIKALHGTQEMFSHRYKIKCDYCSKEFVAELKESAVEGEELDEFFKSKYQNLIKCSKCGNRITV
jgi:ribosomal protein S27E